MDLAKDLLRRSKDKRFIGGGLTALLLVCALIYYLLQRGRTLPQSSITSQLLLFGLWYVNIILILTLVFVLVRNLFRVLVDRHNRILGSKFKTKLVLTSIALSLIPVVILFPFATRLVVDSFEQWFDLPIEEVVKQASETAIALTHQIETTNLRDANRVLDSMLSFDLNDLKQRPALQHSLQEWHQELDLDYLALYDGIELIHGTADPFSGISRDLDFRGLDRFLREAIAEGEAMRIETSPSIAGRVILAARAHRREPVKEAIAEGPTGQNGDGTAAAALPDSQQHTVVVTATILPADLAEKSEALIRAYQSYLQLASHQEDLRTLYLQMLLMVALLVILAFSSIGMRLARRFTVPIQALADGTRRIASGDLDHYVDVSVDDELGVLVDAFNHMTLDLKRNKELVDRSNRELRDANEQLGAVLQNVAAGVISINAAGRVQTCNGAALSILCQHGDEVIGQDLRRAWSDPERSKLLQVFDQDLIDHRELSSQVRLTVGAVWKTLEVKVTGLTDSSGRARGKVLFLEDLTELIHAQKMATWNEVARRIAHEIKNPLTPIKLTAERLLKKHQQGDPHLGTLLEEGVEIISREVATLKNMVDEFSRFARMPQPRPQEVDLEEVIDDVLKLYEGLKPGVVVESRVAPEAGMARFDPEQLKSVLINLLDNALEATDGPGSVSVSTAASNGNILLHVKDSGRGVPAVDKEKLFLPYFSTKGRGTGLGLAIVHRIVTDHYASIRVEDNQPQGTVFTLELSAQ